MEISRENFNFDFIMCFFKIFYGSIYSCFQLNDVYVIIKGLNEKKKDILGYLLLSLQEMFLCILECNIKMGNSVFLLRVYLFCMIFFFLMIINFNLCF